MAFAALEHRLASDTSAFALYPGEPERLHQAVMGSYSSVLDGIPHGTLKADDNGCRWAAMYCLDTNSPFLRPLVLTPEDVPREQLPKRLGGVLPDGVQWAQAKK